MTRTNRTAVIFLGVLLASAASAGADEIPKPEPAKEAFYLYGGGCSRSIRLQATYATLAEALQAAETIREKETFRWVTVRTGAHQRDYFGQSATQYRVYCKPCRGGWQLRETVENAEKTKQLVEKLKADGERVGWVGYYAAK